eukprot:scpid102920/ scgid19401/ Transcription factor SOX-13; SRY (Sex determining region Y)-box 13
MCRLPNYPSNDDSSFTSCASSASSEQSICTGIGQSQGSSGDLLVFAKDGFVKRPTNAFMLWAKGERPRIFASLRGDQHLSNSDVSKILGKTWREMSTEEKAPFHRQASRACQQYRFVNPKQKRKQRPPKTRVSAQLTARIRQSVAAIANHRDQAGPTIPVATQSPEQLPTISQEVATTTTHQQQQLQLQYHQQQQQQQQYHQQQQQQQYHQQHQQQQRTGLGSQDFGTPISAPQIRNPQPALCSLTDPLRTEIRALHARLTNEKPQQDAPWSTTNYSVCPPSQTQVGRAQQIYTLPMMMQTVGVGSNHGNASPAVTRPRTSTATASFNQTASMEYLNGAAARGVQQPLTTVTNTAYQQPAISTAPIASQPPASLCNTSAGLSDFAAPCSLPLARSISNFSTCCSPARSDSVHSLSHFGPGYLQDTSSTAAAVEAAAGAVAAATITAAA